MIELSTVDDVVKSLGGTKAVAELFGRGDPAVSNWRKAGYFPAHTYLVIKNELSKIERRAPDSLWNMAS
jgi:hypothetical protein